jgi:ABC-type polysaccharide transport system permease subunit
VKALILYIAFVVIGAVLSSLLGVYLEHAFNSTVSLIVFLACFFANFAVSWIIVIYVMDGTLNANARPQ